MYEREREREREREWYIREKNSEIGKKEIREEAIYFS